MPAQPLVLGDYQVHTAREGFSSILHRSSGEIMHSITPPMDEARGLYVEGSGLAERLVLDRCDEELVIWDVGLGAAANAIAAIECFEEIAASRTVRPMRILSFENDLDSLRLALANDALFPYLRHSAPSRILQDGYWESATHAGLRWTLIPGDFIDTMFDAPAPPEVIFYDLFSRATHAAAWSAEAFRRLYSVCSSANAELFTYTYSTSARAAMLAAGFYVARGRVTGKRPETTIALTEKALREDLGSRRELLGGNWLAKWHRSTAKMPADVRGDGISAFERAIVTHPQFQACCR